MGKYVYIWENKGDKLFRVGDHNERWKCRCQGCPLSLWLAPCGHCGSPRWEVFRGKMFRGKQWVLSSTCCNELLCWFPGVNPKYVVVCLDPGTKSRDDMQPGSCCCFLVSQSCPKLWDSMDYSPPGSSVHRDSPGKNIGVGSHFLPQEIFPTQGLNLCLLNWQADFLPLCHQGSPQPRMTEI